MMENTLSSTNQSRLEGDESLNANSPKQSPSGFSLLDIPHFTGSKTESPNPLSSTEPSSWSPSTVDEPTKWEYEFSNFDGTGGYICILWDTNDISACERVVHRPLTFADITYSSTGNGFVNDGDLRYTFTKTIFQRSAILPNSKADKILASL